MLRSLAMMLLCQKQVSLNSSEFASSVEIDLENIAGTSGETKVVYFMLPPADCNGLESFTASLIDSENTEYPVDIEKKNVESGKAYCWQYSLADFIYPSESVYNVDPAGGELQVAINTNMDYSVQIPETASNWLSLIDAQPDYLTLSCTANDGLAREAEVSLLNNNGVKVGSFKLMQDAAYSSIYYTTNDNNPLMEGDIFNNSALIDHKFENGVGQLIFSGKIAYIEYAFSNCSSLASVTIPSSVTSIGEYAFHGCSILTSI